MLKKRVKGCYDRYPNAKEDWQKPEIWKFVDEAIEKVVSLYGFKEVVTPSFEYTEVFTRSSGEESDIVSKEMYTFEDKKGRSLSLRPELTAPTLRAYIENGGMTEKLSKLFYKGSCYRYDRAQKGRYRQFHQFGVEVIGQKDPFVDIEVIGMLIHFFELLGITKTTLLINSIGSKKCRERYGKELVAYFSKHIDRLSDDSRRRLETNPLRILDSKDPTDIEIAKDCPKILDFIGEAEKTHFDTVLKGLDSLGISYKVDNHLVRGLDYYTDTVFELVRADDASAQNSLGGGGVYDGLVKALGGKDLPGVGFALGLERTIQYLLDENIKIPEAFGPKFYCIGLNAACKNILCAFADSARKADQACEVDPGYAIKGGLKKASEKKAGYAIILGEDEFKQGICKVKDLDQRKEETIELKDLPSLLSKNSTVLA
jgi:histidyl-tRNA synthetase